MKINSIYGYSNPSVGDSSKPKEKVTTGKHRGMWNCEQENNMKFSGNFTGKSEVPVKLLKETLFDKLFKSEKFGHFLEYVHNHNIATSALIALGFAGVLRPATILSLPGKKDKEDKIYASGHSIASGLIGFVVSLILTSPLDEALKDHDGTFYYKSKKLEELDKQIKELKAMELTPTIKKQLSSLKNEADALKLFTKNIPDWFIAVPRAMLTIALIPPILKYVFGVDKNKKQVNSEVSALKSNIQGLVKNKFFDFNKSMAFKEFKEGGQS